MSQRRQTLSLRLGGRCTAAVDGTRIAQIINGDVSLAASVLKAANSPAFGLSRRVGNVAQAVPVTLGRQLGDLREISGELKQGDKLVGTPPARLSDGARVRLATS